MSYRKLIKSWHQKANEDDYFAKFIFEYLSFIAFVKSELFPNRSDRQAIQLLKRDCSIKNQYLEKIRNDRNLKYAWEKIKRELDRAPLGNVSHNFDNVEEIKWWNCSHESLERKTQEEIGRQTGILFSLDDWENMIEFWYSIRNNLFHGAKDPEVKRDKIVVEYGYKTLKELVKIFLRDI